MKEQATKDQERGMDTCFNPLHFGISPQPAAIH